jgi:hypothetical protein
MASNPYAYNRKACARLLSRRALYPAVSLMIAGQLIADPRRLRVKRLTG